MLTSALKMAHPAAAHHQNISSNLGCVLKMQKFAEEKKNEKPLEALCNFGCRRRSSRLTRSRRSATPCCAR
jgi:hypothetical protein